MQEPIEDPTEFFEGNDRVLALMNMRRRGGDNMQRANEMRATLCNKLQELVRSVPGLRDRIVAVSEIDPELSAYIMALESINSGIWCPTCKTAKKFGGVPTQVSEQQSMSALNTTPNTTQAARAQSDERALEYTKLQAHFRSAKEALSMLSTEHAAMKDRMDLLTIKLESYATRMNALMQPQQSQQSQQVSSRVTRTVKNDTEDKSTVKKPTEQKPTLSSVFSSLKKEDLPPAPELEINFTVGEAESADSLLE
jgi:hypothetical protein